MKALPVAPRGIGLYNESHSSNSMPLAAPSFATRRKSFGSPEEAKNLMTPRPDFVIALRRRFSPWLTMGTLGLLAALAIGCDLNFEDPTEQLGGTYRATFVYTNRNPDGTASAVDCDGTMVIEQQGNDLTGTITRQTPCVARTLSFTGVLGFKNGLLIEITEEGTQSGFSPSCTVTEPGPFHGAVLEGEITLSRPYDWTCSPADSGHGAEVIGASP